MVSTSVGESARPCSGTSTQQDRRTGSTRDCAQDQVAGPQEGEDEDSSEEMARLAGLVDIEIGRKHKRPMCLVCGRPESVCWCQAVGDQCSSLQAVRSLVLVLQHPHEEKRCLRTAPMLENALPRCRVLKGKKFCSAVVPELLSPDSVVLFPGPDAVDVSCLPTVRQRGGAPYNLLVLDGTWHQARAIMHKTKELHSLKKVVVRSSAVSQYVIRTQPSDAALSTVESAALALAALEGDPAIYSILVQPLATLCQHQISHGAVVHHSKERRYKEAQGTVLGKRTAKTLSQCGAQITLSSKDKAAGSALDVTGDGMGAFEAGRRSGSTECMNGKGEAALVETDESTSEETCDLGNESSSSLSPSSVSCNSSDSGHLDEKR